MKTYWDIQGPSKAPQTYCIAFDKLDGSNLRFEWNKKTGWHKFGTRQLMFDQTDPNWSLAIPIFMEKYAEPIEKVLKSKQFRAVEKVTAFCEFYGPNSFAGWHDFTDMTLTLFDVEIYKKGFVLPRDFIKFFGHLDIPKVIYEGNFGRQLIDDVKEGKYPVTSEGVVCKGIVHGKKKSDQHGLWMAKIKTKKWMAELRKRYTESEMFRKQLMDNEREQI